MSAANSEGAAVRALLVTRGHPFERDPFFAMFDAMPGIETTHVEQPGAQAYFSPAAARDWDACDCFRRPPCLLAFTALAFGSRPQGVRAGAGAA